MRVTPLPLGGKTHTLGSSVCVSLVVCWQAGLMGMLLGLWVLFSEEQERRLLLSASVLEAALPHLHVHWWHWCLQALSFSSSSSATVILLLLLLFFPPPTPCSSSSPFLISWSAPSPQHLPSGAPVLTTWEIQVIRSLHLCFSSPDPARDPLEDRGEDGRNALE